jgi:hypothetical protein
MRAESHPGSLSGMADDQLATIAVSLVVSELQWTPDLAPAVMDRISRDAVAYPEQFDRRPPPPQGSPAPSAGSSGSRSAKRTVGRVAVFGVILVVIVALVVLAATANAAAADLDVGPAIAMPIGAIDGTLDAIEQGGRTLHVVMETS